MSYQVLARKWRPKRFEDVIGQEHVTRSLQNALRAEKMAHAYLFTGTRGVGKTSIARLFAKAVRCETRGTDMNPCGTCVSCLDIEQGNSLDYQEIDGASHNSVENIRDLIENVRYLPARGKFKLYVIDEVHMLSSSAFNALLKTLEEPPEHVIFVFATTDAHKLLGTVLSRCHRFDFKNVNTDVLIGHINKVASAEKISFSDPTLIERLAEYGKGSVRDTLSLFDQVLSLAGHQSISEENFFQALGLARTGSLSQLIGLILQEKPLEASQVFQGLLAENIDLKRIIDQLLDSFYKIIQKIDEPNFIYSHNLLPKESLKGISYAEIFWIYESFTKDCQWALLSPAPEKVVDLVVQKLARRRQILRPDHALIQSSAGSNETAEKKTKIVKNFIPLTLEEFTRSLEDAPTIKANLELGDFVEKPKMIEEKLNLVIGFPEDETMPIDYLKDPEVMAKLKLKASEFYKVTQENLVIKMIAVEKEESETLGFSSISQRVEEKTNLEVESKRNQILNDPYIKEAEKLFNTKVDKIILKESKL